MTEFSFYLLDQMLMLFSYENRRKVFFVKAYKSVKFHFRLDRIPRKTGDWE